RSWRGASSRPYRRIAPVPLTVPSDRLLPRPPLPHRAVEPQPRAHPVPLDGGDGAPRHLGDLVVGEAAEEPVLHDLGQAGRLRAEPFERLVEGEEVGRALVGGDLDGVEGDGRAGAAALLADAGSGAVEEDVAHGPRGEGDEVRAVGRRDALAVDEAEVRFVDEAGRVEGGAGAVAAQAGVGEAAEL